MQQSDATTEVPCTLTAYRARSCPAAWIAGVTVVAVSLGRWRGFVYASYAGAVLFQCGVLALLLAWAWQGPRKRAAPSWERMYLTSYAVLSAASCIWAPNMRSSAIGAIPILFALTWALLLGRMLRTRASMVFIARAIFLAGTLAATMGIYYVLRYKNIDAVEKVVGHRNFLAIFLLPPLLLGIADLREWIADRHRQLDTSLGSDDVLGLAPAFVIPCLVIMMGALLLCTSVGAILGLGAGLLCLLAMNLSRRKRLLLVLAIALVAIVGLVVVSLPPVTKWLLEKHPSQATRLYMWRGSIRMLMQRPIFGWGAGMFMPHFADFKPTEPMRCGLLTDITLYPHNEFLLVAVEGGVIALLLYAAGILAAMRRHVAAVDSTIDHSERALPWALFAGFAAMTVQGMVSVALRFWAPSTLYWTLAGLLLAFPAMKSPPALSEKPKASFALLRLAVIVIPVAAIAWGVVWSGARAESLVRIMVKGQRPSHEVYNKRLDEAIKRSRHLPERYIAMRRRVRTLVKLKDLDGAIALCESLEREAPGLGSTRVVLSELYYQRAKKTGEATGGGLEDLKRSAGILERTIKQNPFNTNAQLEFARVAMLLSPRNLPIALEHTKAALEADPESAHAHQMMGLLLMDKGEKQAALNAFDRAEALCGETDTARLEEIRAARTRLTQRSSGPGTPSEMNGAH